MPALGRVDTSDEVISSADRPNDPDLGTVWVQTVPSWELQTHALMNDDDSSFENIQSCAIGGGYFFFVEKQNDQMYSFDIDTLEYYDDDDDISSAHTDDGNKSLRYINEKDWVVIGDSSELRVYYDAPRLDNYEYSESISSNVENWDYFEYQDEEKDELDEFIVTTNSGNGISAWSLDGDIDSPELNLRWETSKPNNMNRYAPMMTSTGDIVMLNDYTGYILERETGNILVQRNWQNSDGMDNSLNEFWADGDGGVYATTGATMWRFDDELLAPDWAVVYRPIEEIDSNEFNPNEYSYCRTLFDPDDGVNSRWSEEWSFNSGVLFTVEDYLVAVSSREANVFDKQTGDSLSGEIRIDGQIDDNLRQPRGVANSKAVFSSSKGLSVFHYDSEMDKLSYGSVGRNSYRQLSNVNNFAYDADMGAAVKVDQEEYQIWREKVNAFRYTESGWSHV